MNWLRLSKKNKSVAAVFGLFEFSLKAFIFVQCLRRSTNLSTADMDSDDATIDPARTAVIAAPIDRYPGHVKVDPDEIRRQRNGLPQSHPFYSIEVTARNIMIYYIAAV